MKTSSPPLRAPAKTLKITLFERFTAFIAWLLWPVIGCGHRRPSLPYNNHQTCLDCGATRLYLYADDFAPADAGITIGPWRRDIRPQDAHKLIAKTIVNDAVRVNPYTAWEQPAPTPPTLLKCLDCGDELNPFGICPHASTQTIALSRSPIHCGKVTFTQADCRHTMPDGATCKECGATLNADGSCPANLRRAYGRLDVMA